MKTVVIVGAGFFGSVMADRFAREWGWRVLLLDKRGHVGGNSWSTADSETGVEEHIYGPHIFHTRLERVWNYVRQYTSFNDYRHTVWATRKGKVYPLPFGLAAINLLKGSCLSPEEARAWVAEEVAKERVTDPKNLEEKALSLVGRTIYQAFIKDYTEKHWGRKATELPAYIITRLPVRYTYGLGYYNDPWQGIPVDGYGAMFQRMLNHPLIEFHGNSDYFREKGALPAHDLMIYTGAIDRFFEYKHGRLGWRSVRFEKEILHIPDYQGTSVMNECDAEVAFTRTHEYKHFTPERTYEKTLIHREYSYAPKPGDDEYYPIRHAADLDIYARYEAEAAETCPNIIFGGRLGSYRYLDMDQAIDAALQTFDQLKKIHSRPKE